MTDGVGLSGTRTITTEMEQLNAYLNDLFLTADLRDYILTALGHILYAPSPSQYMFLFKGSGSNGKSLFLTFLEKVFGDSYSRFSGLVLSSSSDNNHPCITYNKDAISLRLGNMSMVDCINAFHLKRILSGEFKYGIEHEFDEFYHYYTFKGSIVMEVNDFPRINASDSGSLRRIKVIPFSNTFRSTQLMSKLAPSLFEQWKYPFIHLLRQKYEETNGVFPTAPEQVVRESEAFCASVTQGN